MCFSGHIVIGGLYVHSMKINVFCIEGSVRKYNHLCKKWKRFPERKVLTRSVWLEGCGRLLLLLVSPYSAVPGFIGPFTVTETNVGQKQSCGEQMGFSGTFFSSPAITNAANQTQISF